ncbi:hypothetical protein LXL04_016707 [Taraxacum kok-saghyz]
MLQMARLLLRFPSLYLPRFPSLYSFIHFLLSDLSEAYHRQSPTIPDAGIYRTTISPTNTSFEGTHTKSHELARCFWSTNRLWSTAMSEVIKDFGTQFTIISDSAKEFSVIPEANQAMVLCTGYTVFHYIFVQEIEDRWKKGNVAVRPHQVFVRLILGMTDCWLPSSFLLQYRIYNLDHPFLCFQILISKQVGTKTRSTPTKNRTAAEKPRQPSSSEKRSPPGSQSKRQNRSREIKVISNNRETKGNQTTSRNQTGQQKTPRGEQGQKCPNPQGHQQPNNTQGGAPYQRSRQETNQTAQPKPDQKWVKTPPRGKTTTKGKNVQKRPNPLAQQQP